MVSIKCVTVPGHPARSPARDRQTRFQDGAFRSRPRTPGFRMKVSSLKIPVTSRTPFPVALVVRSPWYHAGTKGAVAVVRTNSVKSVFGGRLNTSTCMFLNGPRSLIVNRPEALLLRHDTAPAELNHVESNTVIAHSKYISDRHRAFGIVPWRTRQQTTVLLSTWLSPLAQCRASTAMLRAVHD